MSTSTMDWSRRSSNGAVAHTNNQQYLPQSTSSTVLPMQSHTVCAAPNAYSSAQTFVTNSGNTHTFLKRLLGANSSEEILNIQRTALSQQLMQQTTQVSPGQYNSSFSPQHKTTTATNHQSGHYVQNPVVSSYQIQVYPNPTVQSLQQGQPMLVAQQQGQPMLVAQQQGQPMPVAQQQAQPMPVAQQQAQPMPVAQQQAQPMPVAQQQAQPMPVAQQQAQPMPVAQQQARLDQFCVANGYNTRDVQQILQSSQHGRSALRKAYHPMPNSSAAKRHGRNVQVTSSWQTMPQPNSQPIYSVPNGGSGPYTASYKPQASNENVSVSTSSYQNGQHIQSPMGSNYQTNTLQPQREMTDCAQSTQRLMPSLHGAYANNSNVSPSATVGQMPPPYPQSNTNASNVYNASVNQRLSNPNQNVVAQNVQQLVQSYAVAAQDQQAVALPPPAYTGNVTKGDGAVAQNLLALLKVYKEVKLKYLSLNRANNILRQKMQSSPRDNSGAVKPPLICSIRTSTGPTNDPMGGQEVTQNFTAQSQPMSNTTHGVQSPTLHDNSLNVPTQNLAQSTNSFSSHGYPTNNCYVLKQINYNGFDSGQMSLGSSANSSGQAVGSETVRNQNPQETSIQANNQYLSSGNSSNGNLSQDCVYMTTDHSLAQTTATSERLNPFYTTNTQNFYHLTSNSREAINASLPLWKSVPQSTAQNNSGYPEPEQNQHRVDNGLNTSHPLDDNTSGSINERTAVTLNSAPNVSKVIEPQIAIVSPLVQMKNLVNEVNQRPKVVPQGENLANDGVHGLKESECFNKLLQALESVNAAAGLNNHEGVSSRSSRVSSSCSVEGSSNDNVDQNSTENIETVDDGLQISGICTLVEDHSFFDSSIAMMFDGSLQAQPGSPLAKTDSNSDHALQCSPEDVGMCGASPTTEMAAGNPEPQGVIEPCASKEDDQQSANDSLEIQPEKNLSSSDVLDLEPNTGSDQLSELLTEFPFGIKNYMSKYEHKSTEVSLGKFTEKPKIPKTPVPSWDDENDGSIENTREDYAMETSTEEIACRSIEDTNQRSIVERVSTPEPPTDEGTSEQLEDDGFEISDSPDGNIHITLLDQDQIDKLFPEDCTKPIVQSEESVVKSFAQESGKPVVDVAESSTKETSDDETASAPDKELFCCLFSWLTLTNGNAPKCTCKLTELGEMKEFTENFSQNTAVIIPKPSGDDLALSTNGHQPVLPNPCNKDEIQNDEIQPPVIKRPRLEPIKISLEGKHGPRVMNCSPQEEIKVKEEFFEKDLEDKLEEELRKIDTLTKERNLQSTSHLGYPDSKKSKDPSMMKSNVDGQQKLDKLIVKTDFLKVKKKYKEMKMNRVEEGGAKNVQKIKSREVGESTKTSKVDRIVVDKANIERCKMPATTVRQSNRSMNKLKSSSSSKKSHSQAPPMAKRRGRPKSRPESHSEKKILSKNAVQEYLERKRALCNRRLAPKVDPRDEPGEVRPRVVEKHSMERPGNNLLTQLRRPLSPAKINTKTIESEASNISKKVQLRTSGAYEPLHKKHRGPSGSHGKGASVNPSSKEKIYLSACVSSSRTSYDGISLTKLQIRRSPVKPDRRKSLDSSVQGTQSESEKKYRGAPQMLEFKLFPEFDSKSPTRQERKAEPKIAKEKHVGEGIKSKKEAWCSSVPPKKRWMNSSSEEQGHHSPSAPPSAPSSAPSSSLKTLPLSSTKKSPSRPAHDSQTTFNVFRQMYHEKRSKSLDSSV